jgi:preprotein translocase subunit SecD
MLIRTAGFNIYLILALVLGATPGCMSPARKEKHFVSTLRLYLEARAEPLRTTETAEVYRAHPVHFTVDQNPFLNEGSVKEAKVIDTTGGFALEIKFDRQGSWLLEQYTSANRNKHIVVSSQFVSPGEEMLNHGRWLAAPQIQTHITDGVFVFTPDASREEAERIALGLNHVAQKLATGQEVKW